MVYSIRIAIFAIKKIKWQENPSGLRFVSDIYFLQVTHFSESNSCLTDHNAQRE